MAESYTVRLPDGNEYGPVAEAEVRAWFGEGRIGPDSWILKAGGAEWLPLDQAFDLAAWQAGPPPHAPVHAHPPAHPAGRVAASRPAPGRSVAAFVIVGAVLVLAAGTVWFARHWAELFPDKGAQLAIQQWASADRTFRDDALGLTVAVPDGWVVLRSGNPFVVRPRARLALAHPGVEAFAALEVDPAPIGVSSLDDYAEWVARAQRETTVGFQETGRTESPGPPASRRRLTGGWETDGRRLSGITSVTHDAWNYVALSGWWPESQAAAAEKQFEALERGLSLTGALTAKVDEAAGRVAEATPHLSKGAAALLVGSRMRRGLAPEGAARMSFRVASQGLSALTPEETIELTQIYTLVYKPIPEKDRVRLASYLERVKAGERTSAEDDQQMLDLMNAGVGSLPEETRARLQQLYEKAIPAGLALEP